MANQTEIETLYRKFLANQASKAEISRLLDYFEVLSEDDLRALIKLEFSVDYAESPATPAEQERLENILARVHEQMGATHAPVIPMQRRGNWKRWTAVAAVFLLVASSIFFLLTKKDTPETSPLASIEQRYKNDVLPGINTPTLTLSDGTVIRLDSSRRGQIAMQGASGISNINGEIIYDSKSEDPQSGQVHMNILSTPRGSGQLATVLSDGTKVWLNAASSLQFPARFSGNIRRVALTGEAYFEVAHNSKIPFVVSAAGTEVKVLGTHFNVMAYPEQIIARTTLLEGAVAVKNGEKEVVLKPGQQAQFNTQTLNIKITAANTDQAVAWKEGLFSINGATLKELMEELSRWYDVEVIFEGNADREFYLSDLRSKSLGSILRGLEKNNIHFKIEGKRITVLR